MTALTHAILCGPTHLAELHNSCDIPAGFFSGYHSKTGNHWLDFKAGERKQHGKLD